MSDNLFSDLNKSIREKETLTEAEQKELARLRAINTERVRRYRQRRKLKDAVADFVNRLHLYTANHLDKNTLTGINIDLKHILKLRPNWTENDLELAYDALQTLERKYLGKPRSNIPDKKPAMQSKLIHLLFQSKLTDEEQLQVALGVLDSVAKKIVIKVDVLSPSRENTLALLSQNLENGVPTWFDDAVIDLLAEKYTGDNLVRMLLKTRKVLTYKRIDENDLMRVVDDEED